MDKISRRHFLQGAGVGALGALGAGALMACSPSIDSTTEGSDAPDSTTSTDSGANGAMAGDTPAFLIPPDPITDDQISQTFDTEIVVVGGGLSGLAAARSAAEKGARVAVIEKGESFQYRSGQFGIYNSKLQQQLGMDFDPKAAISDLMKEMGYRPNQLLWNQWADHSGEAYDWFLEPAGDNIEILNIDATSYDPDKVAILKQHFPAPAQYDPSEEYSPVYPEATLAFIPDQGKIIGLTYQKCVDLGVDFHFSTWARQLIRPNSSGRVEGVIAEDIDGNYLKINASKAVIMCAGDYGNNPDMVKHYCGGRTYFGFFPNIDAKGEMTNVGDGQCMSAWIGAKIEDGPHAPMTHTLGGAVGIASYFIANTSGLRFMNEDVAGQQLSSQIFRQRDEYVWQIFDDKYPEQFANQPAGFANINWFVDDESTNPHLEGAGGTIGRTAITSREEVESYSGGMGSTEPGIYKADTLEELVTMLDLDDQAQKTLLDQIERYNELCAKGHDDDFGKTPKRLWPITTAPYYATKIGGGGMLVCVGGLTVDPQTLNVLDTEYTPIDGLYAAGNNMGCRILQDYPVTIAGVSHGTALTFGYLAGNNAVGA
jgi:succinate dehydrogenase/fumarate reductase flavoprotein subunit